MAEDVRVIGHGKPQFSQLARGGWGDEQFLLGLADHSLQRCFTRIDLSSRAVDFSRSEAALLFDQKDVPILHDEHKRGVDDSLPLTPVDGGGGHRWNFRFQISDFRFPVHCA